MIGIKMEECKGMIGGAIYLTISKSGILTINESSSFISCESTSGSGGGIYGYLKNDVTTGSIEISSSIFSSCS
jgi:hypothetical protein